MKKKKRNIIYLSVYFDNNIVSKGRTMWRRFYAKNIILGMKKAYGFGKSNGFGRIEILTASRCSSAFLSASFFTSTHMKNTLYQLSVLK